MCLWSVLHYFLHSQWVKALCFLCYFHKTRWFWLWAWASTDVRVHTYMLQYSRSLNCHVMFHFASQWMVILHYMLIGFPCCIDLVFKHGVYFLKTYFPTYMKNSNSFTKLFSADTCLTMSLRVFCVEAPRRHKAQNSSALLSGQTQQRL